MEDKLYQYMLEHKSFSIPEIQMKLSLPYKYVREYVAKLEEDGDVILQPDGLEYCLDLCEFEYEFDDEDEEDEEVNDSRKEISFLLEQRRRELEQRKEELNLKKLEDSAASLTKPPKEYVWILWYCIKENEIKITSIKNYFSFPLRQILKALNWMKEFGYSNKILPQKIELSKNLFLSFYGDYEPYNPNQHENILYKVAYHCIKNNCVSVNAIQIAFDLGFAKTNELLEELEQKGILSPTNETKDRNILVDEDTLFKIFYDY